MKEITIKDLIGGKVIAMRREFYLGSDPGDDMFEEKPAEQERYHIFIAKTCMHNSGRSYTVKYEITLSDAYGWCGSGYTTASWGYMDIKQLNYEDSIGPLTHVPVDKNLILEYAEDEFGYDDCTTNVFTYSGDGGDVYYPCGGISVNLSLFEELPRAMSSRPRYIFSGASGLGKSTIGMLLGEKLSVYETDSRDILPEVIWEDVVILGNKHRFTKEDVANHLSSRDNVIFVDFSKFEDKEIEYGKEEITGN